MKTPHLRLVALAVLLLSTLTGCGTMDYSRNNDTGGFSGQRVQDQIYQAATGPYHVGSTYTK